MKALFIGGTGNLSSYASAEARKRGIELVQINRGRALGVLGPAEGVETIVTDAHDGAALAKAVGKREFDVVLDFTAMVPLDIERDLRVFAGKTGQYVFLSSASAYQKPPPSHLVTEATPLGNPYWDYSRGKIAAEERLAELGAELGLAWTVVRPSHTYGRSWIPTPFGSMDFTIASRMLAGKDVPVPGDGQGLWTLTHARDFAVGLVGLFGKAAALGQAFNVTGDEALTWDEVYRDIARALGVEARLVHVPMEVVAKAAPEFGMKLFGDKGWTTVFDCSKLRALVPEFQSHTRFAEGIRESVAWYQEEPSRQRTLPATEAALEAMLAAWKRALAAL